MQVTIDNAGRIVIPKTLRDELRLEPGDALELDAEAEGLMLRPVRSSTRLRKEHGVWVYRTGQKLPATVTDRVLRGIREQRNRHNTGSTE